MTETNRTYIGSIELTERDVNIGHWLKDSTVTWGLRLDLGGRSETFNLDVEGHLMAAVSLIMSGNVEGSENVVLDAKLHPRVTRGPMSVVEQAAEDAGLFEHRSFENYGREDGEPKYTHQYRVDGGWHDKLYFEYEPRESQYGSIRFYLGDG